MFNMVFTADKVKIGPLQVQSEIKLNAVQSDLQNLPILEWSY
jgi:hypothetical protein